MTPATIDWDELGRTSLPRLRRIAKRVIGDSHEAEDVVQDALLIAWQRVGQLNDLRRLNAWLAQIVRNTALNRVASRTRRARIGRLNGDMRGLEYPGLADCRSVTPETCPEFKEALAALSQQLRGAVLAELVPGRSKADPAERRASAAARTRRSRAAKRLRLLLT